MNPTPAVALMKAIAERNREAIELMVSAIAWANEPIAPMVGNPDLFAHYNIQMEKTRINTAGYSNCGPVRPPYQDFPEEYADQARECGQRWPESAPTIPAISPSQTGRGNRRLLARRKRPALAAEARLPKTQKPDTGQYRAALCKTLRKFGSFGSNHC